MINSIIETTKKYKKSIWIIPFMGEKLKWYIWSGKIMARCGIKGCKILIRGNVKPLADNTYETKDEGFSARLKMINTTAYNKHILSQEDKVCFHVVEDSNTKTHKY